jgi:hypothetical protein
MMSLPVNNGWEPLSWAADRFEIARFLGLRA